MLTTHQKRLKAYGKKILCKPKKLEAVEPKPRPMFQPVEIPEWTPQEGVKLLIVPTPKDL